MTDREFGHALDIEMKAAGDAGEIEGYAAVFGNVDAYGDVIEPGAFKTSLARRVAGKVRMLSQHDPASVIGVWDSLEEDAKGLRAKGRLILGTTAGRDAYELLKAGALDGLSIGYRAVKSERGSVASKSVRLLKEIDLFEISVVTWGANDQATVQRVKSSDSLNAGLEAILNDINAARAAISKGSQ